MFEVRDNNRADTDKLLIGHDESGLKQKRDPETVFSDPKHELLFNPHTEEYHELKAFALSNDCLFSRQTFTAKYDEEWMPYNDLTLYSHTLQNRPALEQHFDPDSALAKYESPKKDLAHTVLQQIANENGFDAEIFRININLTQCSKASRSIVHRDHEFPHWNLLIYLNTWYGGITYVDNEPCPAPQEDMIVTFEGFETMHWHEPPAGFGDERIVLVATYMPREIGTIIKK